VRYERPSFSVLAEIIVNVVKIGATEELALNVCVDLNVYDAGYWYNRNLVIILMSAYGTKQTFGNP
jgi:hypothetical protein